MFLLLCVDLNKQKFMNRPGTLLDIPYSPIDSPDSPIVAGHIERPVLSKIPPTPDSVTNEGVTQFISSNFIYLLFF